MTPLTYPLTEASSSLTTIHNNISSSSSSDPTLRILLHTWNPNLIRLGKQKCGKCRWVSLPETDVYFWRYPIWINDFWEQVFICFYLRRSVSVAPRHHPQSRSVHIRSQPMPYASNNNGNNGHDLGTITSSHIPLAVLQQLLSAPS